MENEQNTDIDKQKKKRMLILNAVFIAAVFVFFYLYNNVLAPNAISKDSSISTAKLISLEQTGMRGMKTPAQFAYTVNGKEYTSDLRLINPCNLEGEDNKSTLMNYNYPVIYSNENPAIADLLIAPQIFEKYDLSFPDSLQTIYNRFWDCK